MLTEARNSTGGKSLIELDGADFGLGATVTLMLKRKHDDGRIDGSWERTTTVFTAPGEYRIDMVPSLYAFDIAELPTRHASIRIAVDGEEVLYPYQRDNRLAAADTASLTRQEN